jgi:hypothetical protein
MLPPVLVVADAASIKATVDRARPDRGGRERGIDDTENGPVQPDIDHRPMLTLVLTTTMDKHGRHRTALRPSSRSQDQHGRTWTRLILLLIRRLLVQILAWAPAVQATLSFI